jgi:hypothetical protein
MYLQEAESMACRFSLKNSGGISAAELRSKRPTYILSSS